MVTLKERTKLTDAIYSKKSLGSIYKLIDTDLNKFWFTCQDIAKQIYKIRQGKGKVYSMYGKFREYTGTHIVYVENNKVYDPMNYKKPIKLEKFLKYKKINMIKDVTKNIVGTRK